MTHEQAAAWIRRVLVLAISLIVLTVGAIGWFYFKKIKLQEQSAQAAQGYELQIVLYHRPGKPESDSIAGKVAELGKTYDQVVLVTTIDTKKDPIRTRLDGVKQTPMLYLMKGEEKLNEYSGEIDGEEVEDRIDQLLHGINKVGADWKPVVPGMTPAKDAPPIELPKPKPTASK